MTVKVEGLKELRRSLGQIDKTLQKNLRGRLKAIGDEVAADARTTMPVKTGRARSSVKAGVSGNTAYVKGGGGRVPYYGWLEYGGKLRPTGRRRNTISRPRKNVGRYLYPAVNRNRADITKAATEAMNETKRELGLG